MRKSTLFISAVLTTFMIAVLFGVVTNYQNNKKVETASQTSDTTVSAALPTATDLPAPTQAAVLTPEQAAALAAQILGHNDLLSVETTIFNGMDAYLVKFIPGDMVYISPQGNVLSIVAAPPAVVYVPASANKNNRNRNNGGGGGGGGGGDDDHHDD